MEDKIIKIIIYIFTICIFIYNYKGLYKKYVKRHSQGQEKNLQAGTAAVL